MTLSSRRPDPLERLSGEGRVHWVRGLLILASMAGVVLIFLVVFSLLQSVSKEAPQIRGLAALPVAATPSAKAAAAQAHQGAAAIATPTAVPTARAGGTTATPASPTGVTASVRGNPFVRAGPGTNYPVLTNLQQGQSVAIIGRTQDFSWFQIMLPDDARGWTAAEFFNVSGDLHKVPATQ